MICDIIIDCLAGAGKDCRKWWSAILIRVVQILNADIGTALAAYTDKEMTGMIVWNKKLSANEGFMNEKGGRGMIVDECLRSRNVLRSGVAVLSGTHWERMKMPEKSSCVICSRNCVSSMFVSSLFYVGEIAVLHDVVADMKWKIYSSAKEKEEKRKLLADAFAGVEEIMFIFGNISNAFSEEMSDEQVREHAKRYLERSGEILKCICCAFWTGDFESSLQWARAADLKVDELMTEICFDFPVTSSEK